MYAISKGGITQDHRGRRINVDTHIKNGRVASKQRRLARKKSLDDILHQNRPERKEKHITKQ
jgi:hypothetical protein